MIGFLALAVLAVSGSAPSVVIVSSPRGEVRVPVRMDPELGPLLPAGAILAALGGRATSDGIWADVDLGGGSFRFLLGAPMFLRNGRVHLLAAPAWARRDTLFLPLQFVSEALPRLQAQRFSYDRRAGRLTDRVAEPTAAAAPSRGDADRGDGANGLRHRHLVAIDPGHGGVDPGNPGLFFPAGLKERDITLAMGLLLRDALAERGVAVVLTRSRDTLIDLRDRGGYCRDDCDLFVSLHVNSLPRRRGYTDVRGFETYFLAEARTEDAARVARMENEAIRYEAPAAAAETGDGLEFILKDLQVNEHLRESARVAALVQDHLDPVHSGDNRGVRQAGFMVLTTARRPAVLVELGYATNREDARLLTQSASQRRLAAALAEAVVAYLAEYERRTDR